MKTLANAALFVLLIVLSVIPPTHIEEDSPFWNCATMGNHICGPVDPSTTTK